MISPVAVLDRPSDSKSIGHGSSLTDGLLKDIGDYGAVVLKLPSMALYLEG